MNPSPGESRTTLHMPSAPVPVDPSPLWVALRLLREDRELRRAFVRPVTWAGLLFVVSITLSYWLIVPPFQGWLASLNVPGWLAVVLWVIMLIPIASGLYLGLLGLAGGFLWDGVSRRVEVCLRHQTRREPLSGLAAHKDTAHRMLYGYVWMFLGMVAPFLPIVGPMLHAFLTMRLDGSAPAMARRGFTLPVQRKLLGRIPGLVPVAGAAALLALVPFALAFLYPFFVIAATVAVVQAEAAGAWRNAPAGP